MRNSFDVEKARKDTPACGEVIHLNNAGASLMPKCVADATVGHIRLEERIGGYEAAAEAEEKLERVYHAAGKLLHCAPEEIAFVENATRAWDMAFYGIPLRKGDRILTAKAEYASNYIAYLQIAKKTGAVVEVIPNDEYGQVSVEALEGMMDERVRLVAVTHVPTNGGLVNPAAEIGRIAKKHGALYLLDACQSVGQMDINVQGLQCDMLSTTGRKYLRGPRGTGLLYVRKEILSVLEPPFLDLHAAEWTAAGEYAVRQDARKFENWETNCAGKIGLGMAIDYALSWGLEEIGQRVSALAAGLREMLEEIPGVTVRDLGKEKCGIVTLTKAGITPEEMQKRLMAAGIHTSVSVPSGTLLDMGERKLEGLLRASVHYYNTEDELERFCAEIRKF